MAHELATPRPDSALMLEALLAQFLVTVNRSRSHAPSVRKPALRRAVQRLLERQFREEHHVAVYAAALGVSADHLSAIVRGHDGHSAKSAIDRRLFSEAAALLTSTDRSVAAIATAISATTSRVISRARSSAPAACHPAAIARHADRGFRSAIAGFGLSLAAMPFDTGACAISIPF